LPNLKDWAEEKQSQVKPKGDATRQIKKASNQINGWCKSHPLQNSSAFAGLVDYVNAKINQVETNQKSSHEE
jgi:hypothetical protein